MAISGVAARRAGDLQLSSTPLDTLAIHLCQESTEKDSHDKKIKHLKIVIFIYQKLLGSQLCEIYFLISYIITSTLTSLAGQIENQPHF
jgi:hypothetical protein